MPRGQWGEELSSTVMAAPHDRRTAARREHMLDWVVNAGGVVLFGLLVFSWGRLVTLEREFFANGNGHYLE